MRQRPTKSLVKSNRIGHGRQVAEGAVGHAVIFRIDAGPKGAIVIGGLGKKSTHSFRYTVWSGIEARLVRLRSPDWAGQDSNGQCGQSEKNEIRLHGFSL